MRLDDLRDKAGAEPLSERLWRRYGRRAFEMLDHIREDPTMAEDILGLPTIFGSNFTTQRALK